MQEDHAQDRQLIEELTSQLDHKSQQYAQLNCKYNTLHQCYKQAEQKQAEELQKAKMMFEDERKTVKEKSNLLEIQSQEIKVLNNKLSDAERQVRESKEEILQVNQREQEAKDRAAGEVRTCINHPETGQKSL